MIGYIGCASESSSDDEVDEQLNLGCDETVPDFEVHNSDYESDGDNESKHDFMDDNASTYYATEDDEQSQCTSEPDVSSDTSAQNYKRYKCVILYLFSCISFIPFT